jgi:multiple sugar transport system substrate-binding protein
MKHLKPAVSVVALCATVTLAAPLMAAPAQAAPATIVLWSHASGHQEEIDIAYQIVKDFNASQSKAKVVIKAFPNPNYNDAVVAAAAGKSLPCLLDIDAPITPSWAWAGYLSPLTIDKTALSKFTNTAKGFYGGKLYSLGIYDAAVGIFAKKSVLKDLGLRTPTINDPWSKTEFDGALSKAKASGKFDYAISMGTGWTGEWYPYAYSPLLQSFGGDLIDRKNMKSAEGVLNGRAAKAWGVWFQNIFTSGYAPKKESATERDTGFTSGKIAFSLSGNWTAKDAVAKLGADFIVLPPPNLGTKPVIGGGSWQWAVSSTCTNKVAANAFLSFALQSKYIARYANDLTYVPGTAAATLLSKDYKPGAPLSIFQQLAVKYALIRPATPAYAYISIVFEKMTMDIIAGADVQTSLDGAVDQIDKNLKDNNYYKK